MRDKRMGKKTKELGRKRNQKGKERKGKEQDEQKLARESASTKWI